MTERVRRKAAWVAIAGFVVLSFSTIAGAAQSIRIGTEGAYFPFNYLDDKGRLQGFDIDIANALCSAMRVECEFLISSWQALIPGLRRNKFDAIIASMSITDQRKQLVDFTDKYYQTAAQFVAPEARDLEISKEGLTGKMLGAQRDTTHSAYLLDNFSDVADVKIYDTQEHLYIDLFSGRLDAALADRLVWLEWLKQSGTEFRLVGEPFSDREWYGEGVGIAVRKEDPELRDRFNEALAGILANGTYEQINKKYFPFSIY